MNNKRQTIWLVSMLSLMVILSAYYLFTEDVTPAQNAAGSKQQQEVTGASKATGDLSQGVEVTEVDPATDQPDGSAVPQTGSEAAGTGSPDGAGKDAAGTDGKDAASDDTGGQAEGSVSPSDEEVLKQMTNLQGRQLLDEMQRVQKEKWDTENERLTAIIADTKNHSQEDASSAAEELTRLEDMESRMTSLEEKLVQDYDSAVVVENESNFKVVVQAAKLEKLEAVKIIDLAAKELNVKPDRLSVQYVP
ncbi:SpoIIIAH-like family protein [Cohnella caldifontis]|uniref:SpoIIIAH-like family protein n=1 Tax=Cohnella caldifontis TaxID=3027471 RepID=UPI0023ED5283|nr:SpoIIIAH-like family protein [Cohnella sp. YIM B05605]